ncbi:MAG: type II secretion system protein [Planctomycetes bacterium]|nr:type II secretion system protein [Planctomycetota bacterium]
MSNRSERRAAIGERVRAFTLIELLVVIAVIALLIGILLPSLASARKTARALLCLNNTRQVAIAVTSYSTENRWYPASYVYPSTERGQTWKMTEQQGTKPQNGYLHWSYALFNSGQTTQNAFECPLAPDKGAPRTNPGPNIDDWDPRQLPNEAMKHITDRQARRMAYGANGAVIGRNKFVEEVGSRNNVLVSPAKLDAEPGGHSRIILATDFAFSVRDGWATISDDSDPDGFEPKAHRPFTPFRLRSGGGNPNEDYTVPAKLKNRFEYPDVSNKDTMDIKRKSELGSGDMVGSKTTLNVVGRHHPGGDPNIGSSAFVFFDGHAEQMTVVDSISRRLWGTRYHSITGENLVYDPSTNTTP